MGTARLKLEFFAEEGDWTLDRVTFHPSDGSDPVSAFRGDRFGRMGPTFSWTKAMRALSLLMVRHASAPQENSALEGGRDSPAQTLFHLLDHPERSAAAVPFTNAQGYCHLRNLLQCVNAGKDDCGQGLKRIFVNAEKLPRTALEIQVDGESASPDLLRRVAHGLALAWPGWSHGPSSEAEPPCTGVPEVELGRFPAGHGPVFGRENEIAALDAAVAAQSVVVVAGAGGNGKTTLLIRWLEGVRKQEASRRFDAIFGWSFSEQNRSADHTMSADACFESLLAFLRTPASSGKSAFQRGLVAARAAASRNALVILDGIETLQIPSGSGMGAPHDPGLRGFLQGMQESRSACCVLSSRLDLPGTSAPASIRLDILPDEHCVELLRWHRLEGTHADMERLVRLGRGHPLTLHLIGGYLAKAHGGSARALAEETFWLHEDGGPGSQARAIMANYDERLTGSLHGALLYLLSLFDRQIAFDDLCDFIFHGPGLPGVEARMMSPAHLRSIARDLHESELLAFDGGIECHPLVVQHFRESFRARYPGFYQRAQSHLYELAVANPEVPFHPRTSPQYEVLLRAFFHAREAGRLGECWREVAWRRIMRSGQEYHMTAHLGEFHLCLRAWASLWETPWEKLHPDLPAEAHPIVQASAGFGLFMIERIDESERVLHRALKNALRTVRPHHGLQAAAVLGFIRMKQGRLAEARRNLAPVAGLARLVGSHTDTPDHVLLAPICHLASVHAQEGRLDRARRLFDIAMERYGRHSPQEADELPPVLMLAYWEFLIASGDLPRFEEGLGRSRERLLSIPLIHQIGSVPRLAAQAALARWRLKPSAGQLDLAAKESREACLQSESNGWRLFHCDNLVTRAETLALMGKKKSAASLFEQALEISQALRLDGRINAASK